MIQEIKKKMLKMQLRMQGKKRLLEIFEEAVQDAIHDSQQLESYNVNRNLTISTVIQCAVANTSQYLKEGIVGEFDLSKSEIDSLIDEVAKETINKYLK